MIRNLFKIVSAASLTLTVALFPMDGSAAESSASTTTPASSNPQGLGNAYSFQVPGNMKTTGCCKGYYDYNHANDNATIVMKNFNQKLAAMQLAIIEALRLGTGQLSGNMREQTGASHTLADQQDDRATVKAIEDARFRAFVDSTSGTTTCYTASGSPGGSLQGTVVTASVAYSNELDKWVRGESPYSEKGQDAAEYYRLEAYCSTYGTDADVKAKLCKSKGMLAGASANAADSLFFKGTSGAQETYDKERAEAANAFIVNSLAPNTYTPLSEAEAQSPEGRKKAARYKTQMARESVGRFLVTEFAKSRDPQSSGSTLASWAKGRVSKMQGMSGVNVDKLSYQQWLAIYAKGFLLDTEGLTASDQNSVTAIKDIKNMMAVLNYVAYEQLEQMQKMNVQLAIQTAILNEQTRTDGIFGLASSK